VTRGGATPDWYPAFVEELRALAAALPGDIARFQWDGQFASLQLRAPTLSHRPLSIEASAHDIEYSFGKLWSEFSLPDEVSARYVLAACDAVCAGRVREVRDCRTGLIYHVYRLTTRGLNEFTRDSDYSLWHWLKLPVRKVKIARLSPLPVAGI
jgi:hypothetical protein